MGEPRGLCDKKYLNHYLVNCHIIVYKLTAKKVNYLVKKK